MAEQLQSAMNEVNGKGSWKKVEEYTKSSMSVFQRIKIFWSD